jgi:flagellar basal body-associated protein FliL
MSVSVKSRRSRLSSAIAVLLTVLVVLPTAVLFLRVLNENTTQRDETELKQKGVEYLAELAPLISALAESQSSSLQGVTAEPASLTAAVARVQGVDESLGDDLDTTSRWSGLKEKIGRLPGISGTSEQVYEAHVEVSDLALELYGEIRENSRLNQDQQADIWFLQETVTVNMPEAVTHVSRMADLANMVAAAKERERGELSVLFGAEILAVEESVGELTDNLQAAAEDTDSSTLASNTVNNLDSFRRGVEAANRGANLGQTPDVSILVTAQSTLTNALKALATVLLKEMSTLLDERTDDLDYRRAEAWVMLAVSIVLLIASAFWASVRTVRAGRETAAQTGRDVSVQGDNQPGYAGAGAGFGGTPAWER